MEAGLFKIDLNLSFGWCNLHLQADGDDVAIKTHWLVDGFAEFAQAVKLLLTDRSSVSVRWPLEVAGGHFIDLVVDPQNVLHVAISEFEHGVGSPTADTIWSAVRGSLVFEAHVPLADFVVGFADCFRRIRVTSVDSSGFIAQWGHSFPQSSYEFIESTANHRYGFKPVRTDEVEREAYHST